MPLVLRDLLHNVERNGILDVRRAEIDDILDTMLGYEAEDALGIFAVRVHDRDAAARLDVLDGHVFQERGFPHPRLPDDIDVLATISAPNAKTLSRVAEVRLGEGGDVVRLLCLGHG